MESSTAEEYYQEVVRRLSRRLLFVDTGAILGYFDFGNSSMKDFLESERLNLRLVTSSMIAGEVARRLVKGNSNSVDKFRGPRGERQKRLAMYLLSAWLEEMGIEVLHTPNAIFHEARKLFSQSADCIDFTDCHSYVLVRGLGLGQIATTDRKDFLALGLTTLPT